MTWDELRAEAFGEIGLLPENFYMMDHEDYFLLHQGFFNKRLYDRRIFRQLVMTVIAPWVKNMPSPYQIMPLPEDDKLRKEIKEWNKEKGITISDKSREVLLRFKEMEKAKK